RSPCTQTSAYPVLNGSSMVGQSGDLGVAGYVAQAGAVGAIGYVEYSYAIQAGFPVAKVLNVKGYYTEPTAGHVAVSLLKAQINMDKSNRAVYLTQDLSQVYTNDDARTYELSSYSYMIMPTGTDYGFTAAKGYTLGDFGKYLLCQGQAQVDALGYSALPINLVKAGYEQLARIPGASIPADAADQIRTCNNPTFSTDGTNTLANTDPYPQDCDKKGPTQCPTGTGGAKKPTTGGGGSGGSGTGNTPGPGASGTASAAPTVACDPSSGLCAPAENGGAGGQDAIAIPVDTTADL